MYTKSPFCNLSTARCFKNAVLPLTKMPDLILLSVDFGVGTSNELSLTSGSSTLMPHPTNQCRSRHYINGRNKRRKGDTRNELITWSFHRSHQSF